MKFKEIKKDSSFDKPNSRGCRYFRIRLSVELLATFNIAMLSTWPWSSFLARVPSFSLDFEVFLLLLGLELCPEGFTPPSCAFCLALSFELILILSTDESVAFEDDLLLLNRHLQLDEVLDDRLSRGVYQRVVLQDFPGLRHEMLLVVGVLHELLDVLLEDVLHSLLEVLILSRSVIRSETICEILLFRRISVRK